MGVVVLVGTDKGGALLRSDERRERWDVGPLAFQGWRVTAAARDAGGRTYVGVATEAFGNAILASDDLVSWDEVGVPRYDADARGNADHNRQITALDPGGEARHPGRYVDQIWKLHCVDGAIYAGVSEAGLFRSTDRGKSWQPVVGLNEHPSRPDWIPGFGGLCLHAILTDARNPERIWAGISSAGVFRSDDGGRTWQPKNEGVPVSEGICVHGLGHDPENADRIYRQDHRGMFLTEDGAERWTRIETGLPQGELSEGARCAFGFPVEVDPATGTAFAFPLAGDDLRYAPDGRLRVYRTREDGRSWEAPARGLPEEPRYTSVLRGAMAVDGLDPCGVYVGTTSGHVFASADRGESWRELPATLPKILCVEAFRV